MNISFTACVIHIFNVYILSWISNIFSDFNTQLFSPNAMDWLTETCWYVTEVNWRVYGCWWTEVSYAKSCLILSYPVNLKLHTLVSCQEIDAALLLPSSWEAPKPFLVLSQPVIPRARFLISGWRKTSHVLVFHF